MKSLKIDDSLHCWDQIYGVYSLQELTQTNTQYCHEHEQPISIKGKGMII